MPQMKPMMPLNFTQSTHPPCSSSAQRHSIKTPPQTHSANIRTRLPSPTHLPVCEIRRSEFTPGDAARQVSFFKHPTLVSMQRWPKTDIDNRSLINLYSSSRVTLFSPPVCEVAYSLESALQHLGGAARCQSKRLSTWRGADERQTGRLFEYNQCEGI